MLKRGKYALPRGEDPVRIVPAPRVREQRPGRTEVCASVGRGRGDGADRVLVSTEISHPFVELAVGGDHRIGADGAVLRHVTDTDQAGRGLNLVSRLARRWGASRTADGKVVWSEQALPV